MTGPSQKYLPSDMLEIRNLIEKQLVKHPSITYGGGAGTSKIDPSADLDIHINGYRYNVRIQARGSR